MTYNIILLGPPGTGKGTQAERMAEHLRIPHISTGDMFRQLASENDPLGLEAKEKYWGKGLLVPDETTIGLVRKRLSKHDCRNGFILDGFPRTIHQAEALEDLLKEMGKGLDHVIEIKSSEDIIVKRLTSRRQCTKCRKIYGIDVPPKVKGVCDVDGASLYHRDDDKEEVILGRLEVYKAQTAPLIEFYTERDKLTAVDGEQPIDKILQDILDVVKS